MTPAQIDLARHALGLPNKRKTSYRNHFVTGEGSGNYADWNAMVEARMARVRRNVEMYGGDDYFRLTVEGAKAALAKGEKLSAEDFPQVTA